MRRVMMDATRDGAVRQLVDRPNAEAYVLKVPEPDESNAGPTGFVGVAERVRSRQETLIEVGRSGHYPSYTTFFGSRFLVKLDYLRDENGDDIVDSTLMSMGAETSFAPHFLQCLVQNDAASTWSQTKMIELKQWGNAGSGFGYLGLMVAGKQVTGTGVGSLSIWRMEDRGPHATEVGYQWESVSHNIPSAVAGVTPHADVVEMDDGSIVLATNFSSNARANPLDIWRSFDGGDTWEIINDQLVRTSDTVALERIGSRLILVMGSTPGASHYVSVYYSDDTGQSWSSENRIHDDGVNQPAHPFVDVATGQDGVMYVAYIRNDGANDETFVQYSVDGVNWSGSPYDSNFTNTCTTILQQYFGRWLIYGVVGGALHRRQREGADLYSSWLTTDKDVVQDANDTDGMNMLGICARTFANENFIDVAVTFLDTHAGNIYGVVVYRLSMWSMHKFVQHELNTYPRVFDSCWSAYCYPSVADGHPNLNHWTRTMGGTGASALNSTDYGYLRLTSGDGASSSSYNQGMSANSFDDGFFAQFKLKVVSGFAHVTVRMCSNPNNEDCLFTVVFRQSDNTILLYDHRAAAVVATHTPTNWRIDDWNEYMVRAVDSGDGNNLQVDLSRAPFEYYKEIAHYEWVINSLVAGIGYTGDNDGFLWGVDGGNPGGSGASDCHWKQVHINGDFSKAVTIDESGRQCHTNPVGIMQGFGCKWAGNFALDDDEWELDVGAHFDADNVFVDSPRICFSDPKDATARTSTIVIDWRRHEGDEATCMNYVFDSIAMFGLNAPSLKLEGADFAGAAWTTLWANYPLGNYTGGPAVYEPNLSVNGAPDQNVVRYTAGTSSMDTWPLPNQYASTSWRKWYAFVVDGACAGRVYRIDGNTSDKLLLECNVEADGVLDGDSFFIFSDRFLHVFDQTFTYPRVRLTMNVIGVTPPPSEKAIRLGTVVLGQTYDLPDDEWESVITTESGVEITRGRSRLDKWRETAPERRSIGLSYTGEVDRGMGSDVVRELYRHARWGVHPVVWIDDDTALVESSGGPVGKLSHTDPILARVSGPLRQQRRFYSYEQQDGGYHKRGAHDVGGVTLEEIL